MSRHSQRTTGNWEFGVPLSLPPASSWPLPTPLLKPAYTLRKGTEGGLRTTAGIVSERTSGQENGKPQNSSQAACVDVCVSSVACPSVCVEVSVYLSPSDLLQQLPPVFGLDSPQLGSQPTPACFQAHGSAHTFSYFCSLPGFHSVLGSHSLLHLPLCPPNAQSVELSLYPAGPSSPKAPCRSTSPH